MAPLVRLLLRMRLLRPVFKPATRFLIGVLAVPLMRLFLRRVVRLQEIDKELEKDLEHWFRGSLLLLVATANMERLLFDWVPLDLREEHAWVAVAFRLLLAMGVIEAMPDQQLFAIIHPGPPAVTIDRGKPWWGLAGQVKPYLKGTLCQHISRSSPVFAIMAAIFGGNPHIAAERDHWAVGWVCYGVAITQYLVIGLVTSKDKALDALGEFDRRVAERRRDRPAGRMSDSPGRRFGAVVRAAALAAKRCFPPLPLPPSASVPRIRQLPPEVVNQIAAGEVIERPASVVKELVENSLDALATRIDVEIERGGADLIRVTDDGEGIAPDDLPLAMSSHATSKLETAADLFRVRTMGFRGEAVASIASVSDFRLRSRTAAGDTAWEVSATAGGGPPPRACGGPVGTTVEVRDLFHNVPVRRKFLKGISTEFGHITEQFTRLALANPRLHATLRHGGRTVFDLPPASRLLDRLTLFHGRELADKLIPVESEHEGVRLSGFVGHPSLSKASRKGQYLFLNGRWITDRSLQHALGEAYRGLLMVGRHPVAYLYLDLPPELVDVNVHPTKAEVRFEDGQAIYRQLLSTLRGKFLTLNFETAINLGGAKPTGHAPWETGPNAPAAPEAVQAEFTAWAGAALGAWVPDGERDGETGERGSGGLPSESDRLAAGDSPRDPAPGVPTDAAGTPLPVRRAMQVLDTYLVLETDAGLTVIDQHALHERVMYEHLRPRVLGGGVEVQRLLVPEPVELSPKEAALLLAHADTLRQIGYDLEDFGRNTVLLAGYPAMLHRADHHGVLGDIADRLAAEKPTAPDRRDLLDSLLHMMSCKAAVKAGQRLTDSEITALVAQRHLVADAHHCPHGRPTALVLTRDELDRRFGRLG